MTYRKGICCIIKKGNKFLIFHRIQNWRGWEFLKGGIKPGETEKKALERELREETGNTKYKITKTRYKIKYRWKKAYIKDNKKFTGSSERLYLGELLGKQPIKIDKSEHDRFKWVKKEDVLKYITYPERKKAFKYILKNYLS